MPTSKPKDSFRVVKTGKTLQAFASNLEKALKASLPSSGKPYDRVSVLAFHWANDDMGVDKLETELLGVFRDIYGFETESWTIPVVGKPEKQLAKKLVNWTEDHGGERTLRIYIYSGHASSHGTVDHEWYFGGQADSHGNLRGPQVEWLATRTPKIVEEADGDMLYIFDCCSAGSAALRPGPEMLCASGWLQPAEASLKFSFTRALIGTLIDLKGETETVGGIFSILFRRAYQSQVAACPVHVLKSGTPSITLMPLSRETATHQRTKTQHRVLLTVHLKDNKPNLEAWRNWLSTHLPPGIVTADVKIESVFKSSSIVVLVTVPVEIWTMLDMEDETISFASHVFSHNILPELEQSQLPIRPSPSSQGSENMPPAHHYQKSLG
ncbi:hypothetical protein ASPVEDRAFT_148326 [Aspergillus versicolor CBS 583.65]|uniref:Caspase family p20 domain-containing protein n=1 Tax=Aspergillus versicolor CBS 583.65 TaxID=1036611 RepID=A0A1L9PCI9_ASPVE|nr:uncharacterized protein ASPVEDRAFT_148326 [Aspergillus versicolor CBS 583.65]OJI99193.1 hypothetical protein ASPVEDRAFT_148326 [Aspergillus versicolor CBS 583.65]